MSVYPNPRIKWHQLGLVPTANMAFWHQYEAGVSDHGLVNDYSGNGRQLTSGTTDPVLSSNVSYGQPGWYFDGVNTDPLMTASSAAVPLKHLFVLAAHDGAAFDLNRGLVSGHATTDVLTSNNSGTTFFDLGFGAGFEYRKSNVIYTQANQQAPMATFELIEVVLPDASSLDGLQVGKQRNVAGRIWKGWWTDGLGYTSELSVTDRRRVLLYYALRYGVHSTAGSQIPLYFPSKDLMAGTGVVHSRFNQHPRRWEEVTQSYEFEDANRTFNEFGDNPPQRWEYGYEAVTKAEAILFDTFNDTARQAQPFYFKDPEGYLWSNVRIDQEGYNRFHRGNMRWKHEVIFDLIGIDSVGVYEG